MSGMDSRQRIIAATAETLLGDGIGGVSARTIAKRGDFDQALIFSHFDNVENLLVETSRTITRRRAERLGARLREVKSFSELADVARHLHDEEHNEGNVAMLAQLLAGVRTYPSLAPALRENFELFVTEVDNAIDRLLEGSALDGIFPADEFARTISAGFLGAELLAPTLDTDAATLGTIDTLAVLADAVLDAGTLSTAVIRRGLRSVTGTPR